jgi:diguanylate cyclase (GGDEF)-like protein/PAS domain S-box-containing protein
MASMTVKARQTSTKPSPQDMLSHSRDFLLGLSRAAQSVQQADTTDEIYRAVGDQIKSLGCEVTLLMVNDDRQSLTATYTSYTPTLLRKIEKLTGFSALEYRIVFPPESIYARNIAAGKTEYVHWAKEHIDEALPAALRPLTTQIMSLMKIEQGILAPLHVDGEPLGLMMVSGLELNEDDVPAMQSFAGQISAGLRNVRLMKKLQDELSARKLAEEQLLISQSTFEGIFDSITEAIYILDENGIFLKVNLGAEKMYGYPPEYFVGRTPEFLSAPGKNDFIKVAEYVHRAYLGETMEFEFWGRKKDGSIFPKEVRLTPGIYFGRKIVIAVGRDITERKQAEEAVRESESKFHSVITESADGIVLTDESGRIIEFNNAIERIACHKRETVLGQFLWDFQFSITLRHLQMDEHYARVKEAIQKALEIGQSPFLHKTLEAPFVHPDGSVRYIHQSVFSIRTKKGWQLGSITRDFTERKQAEKALLASDEKSKSLYQMLRLMTDNLPDLVWAKDMEGRYTFANKAMVEKLLIAQDTEEPIGKTDMYFAERQRKSHPENPNWHTFGEICFNSDEVVRASQQSERFEEFGNVQGEFLFLDVYKAPFLDEQGNMIGTVGIGRDVTRERKLEEERTQVQDALAASEAELRALFASMQNAVLVIDREGIYRKVAPTNPNGYYITPQELLGKNLTDIFPAKQAEIFLNTIQQVLEMQQTRHIEYQLNLNGQSTWFEAFVSPMNKDRTLWVARDISERKQAESKLYLQSAALEAAANTIVITDHEGIIQWANSAFTNLTGFKTAEVIGKNPGKLVKSGKQDSQFYKELWAAILSGKTWHNELINRRKDGAFYAEEMTITPLRNFEGETSHFIAVKQDISERKKAEALLIQSEQAYRALFENMPIGLYRTSADGQLLDANDALVKMFGFPDRSSLLTRKAEDLYSDPVLNDKFKNEISECGVLSAFEAEFRRHDQTTFWAEDYVHVICDEAGNALYYEGSLINVTERKRAEDELRHVNKSLETAHNELKQMFEHEQVLARTDGLTGLYNRRYLFELATREFNAANRYQRPLTIILFDVDGFKQVNDTFGHALGDAILVQIAQVSALQVRDVDVLARYGGDEFIILLPQTSAQQAFLIAERLRERVAFTRMDTENSPFIVTLSIGVAETVHAPQDASVEDVIRRADQALYVSKKMGRNNTVIYNGA